MQENSGPGHRIIHSHTRPRAMSPKTRRALQTLGYSIIPGADGTASSGDALKPSLRLIDERQLVSAPSANEDPNTPIVLLTSSRPAACEDRRIVDRIQRPAQLRDLFGSFQSALEIHPRRVPRVATQLPARCIRSDRRWPGAVVSLSEGGCLIRTSEPFAHGAQMNLQFALPEQGIVSARAECLYQRENELGLAFSKPSERNRRVIDDFVATRLAGL
jgi:hypothetical protein